MTSVFVSLPFAPILLRSTCSCVGSPGKSRWHQEVEGGETQISVNRNRDDTQNSPVQDKQKEMWSS